MRLADRCSVLALCLYTFGWIAAFIGPPLVLSLLVPYLAGWPLASRESSYCQIASLVWLPAWGTFTLCCLVRRPSGETFCGQMWTYVRGLSRAAVPDSPSMVVHAAPRPQRTVVLASIKVTPIEI